MVVQIENFISQSHSKILQFEQFIGPPVDATPPSLEELSATEQEETLQSC